MAATSFGLDVRSEIELPFLEGSRAAPTGRGLELVAGPNDAESLPWRDCSEPLCDQRDGRGEVVLRIEAHPQDGYLLWGAGHGAHLLSHDGRHLRCDTSGSRADAWQRLLIAQVLPFAALLQGLETLHASAVSIEGRAIALVGASGAGKTSVALELCRMGADFLADDVLALEPRGERLFAHPGTPLAGLHRREAERLRGAARPHAHEILASNERELLLRITEAAERPVPLVGVFLLERTDGRESREPSFEPLESPRSLLGASFNFVLADRERLQRMLDTCALAARTRVERIVAGKGGDATRTAQAIVRRLQGEQATAGVAAAGRTAVGTGASDSADGKERR
jgi:hypothetical protein